MKAVVKSIRQSALPLRKNAKVQSSGPSSEAGSSEEDSVSDLSVEYHESTPEPKPRKALDINSNAATVNRKRKREAEEDDVEGRYLNQLAREEANEQQRQDPKPRNKRQRTLDSAIVHDEDALLDSERDSEAESTDVMNGNRKAKVLKYIPQHESSKASEEDLDLEKSSRTVFLANVSTLAIKSKTAKKTLLEYLTAFTPSLPQQNVKHGIESLRFRSTAFMSSGVPRKGAFARKELMDTTTKSTNAYAVYTTQLAAREAVKKLNGSMVLNRHLRVDSVAHPAKSDHRRCVFVGNLGFVDDETNINIAENEENGKPRRKAKEPADVEEGLWRQFEKAGVVESVRVVRDKTTRVGKGFAYVQFEDANAVEKALLYNEKKFPPLLPRILRVTRAKNLKKAAGQKEKGTANKRNGGSIASHSPKIPSQVQSLSGRAGKLLGRAGAAKVRAATEMHLASSKASGKAKSPESIVFEGYRASRLQGKGALKMRGSGKPQGKPQNRSSRRGAEFKAKGGEKTRT